MSEDIAIVLERALSEALSIIDDLMEGYDWVGTGDSRSAAMEQREYENRVKPLRALVGARPSASLAREEGN